MIYKLNLFTVNLKFIVVLYFYFNTLMLTLGAYTASVGIEVVRNDISKFIESRDGGVPSDPNNIFLLTGASDGIVVSPVCFEKDICIAILKFYF